MKKKVLILGLVLGIVLGVTACSQSPLPQDEIYYPEKIDKILP